MRAATPCDLSIAPRYLPATAAAAAAGLITVPPRDRDRDRGSHARDRSTSSSSCSSSSSVSANQSVGGSGGGGPKIVATRPMVAPASALFMSPPTTPMTAAAAAVGAVPIAASPTDVNVSMSSGGGGSRRRVSMPSHRFSAPSPGRLRHLSGGRSVLVDQQQPRRPQSVNSTLSRSKPSPKRSAMSPPLPTDETAFDRAESRSPLKRRKTSTSSQDATEHQHRFSNEQGASVTSSSPIIRRDNSPRPVASIPMSREDATSCNHPSPSPALMPSISHMSPSLSPSPKSIQRTLSETQSPNADECIDYRGVFPPRVEHTKNRPRLNDREANILLRLAEESSSKKKINGLQGSVAVARASGSNNLVTPTSRSNNVVRSESIDSTNVISDAEHERLIRESSLSAIKSLAWPDHPSAVACVLVVRVLFPAFAYTRRSEDRDALWLIL